ncbi:MAG: DUF4350 domain-containing protein [Thermoplasmatota archaeon]
MRLQRIVALLLLLGIVLGYLIVPALVPAGKSDPQLQAFPGSTRRWNQCDRLQTVLEGDRNFEVMGIIGSPTLLRNVKAPQKTLYIAVGVEAQYTPAERETLREFIRLGGRAIVADDFGYADELSNEYGVTFYGQQMYDEKYIENNTFPLVQAEFNLNPYLLLFSKPTGLANFSYENVSKAPYIYTTIARGSEKSYVDRDGDRLITPGDAHEYIPMIVMVELNRLTDPDAKNGGRLVFVADTAPFQNNLFLRLSDLEGKMQLPAGASSYKGFNLRVMSGSNQEFILALINSLLPNGGKILFDESRHPQSSGHATAIYGSIRAVTLVTSDPLMAGMLSTGILLILAVVVLRAKDKESWIHRFDISSIHRRAALPDTRNVQVERLRRALLNKVRMLQSLTQDELRALKPAQIAQLVRDHDLSELLLNEQKVYSQDEIKALAAKMRTWGKG